ncbi:pleiotropic drug resistance ABC transporter [Gymnopilus junonius]|uniref:Pleiotropic drug resistance ABC transporter n=1 Tax=Gymnopilus junonius TaxID=109634 RepID=A0A9P5NCW2_GYMJU|nr:pleiotropic drug resistance ABC transporter [Gymnopilus junonius]
MAEETPSSTSSRNESHHPLQGLETVVPSTEDLVHSSPQDLHLHRINSAVSRVDVGFFDPTGVQELRRTITRQQIEERGDRLSESSEPTLHIKDDEPFDLRKCSVMRRDEANIKYRTLGVGFRDLRVVGITAADNYLPTLGSLLNPLNIFAKIQKLRHPSLRNILSGFEGVVKPGEMIRIHSVEGNVYYDSITPDDLRKHFRGDVQYCPEDDVHFPTLTVEQTIKFAATTRTPRTRLEGSREDFSDFITKLLTTVFGLSHTLNTMVGDNAIRGVSGGEKKRVSIAEALATRSCIGAWDNSTRGLDASTALEFVRALRIATDSFESATLVSIYQAGESLYQYFDKVCIIYEGRMAYFGAADQAKQYFIDMGYEPANRQTTADFLVAVTDPNARILPRTAAEFAEYFLKSERKGKRRELSDYLDQFVGKPERRRHTLRAPSWNDPSILLRKAVVRRRVQIIKGNALATGLNLFSFVFQGLIMGSVFLKSPEATSAYFSRGGILFFSLLFSALTAMAEIPALYAQRPIVLRHEKAALYHPFIEALALTLVDIPITGVTVIVFSIIIYFMVGLQLSAGQYFIFLLFLFIMSITMKAWFRGIAAAFSSEAAAQSFAGISVLALSIYTAYDDWALRWITYINVRFPFIFESILTNEFRTLNGVCSNLVPQGPGYENVTLANQVCTTVGSQPGEAFVDGNRFVQLSYGFKYSHTWMNFGIVVAFGVGFIIALLIFTEINTSSAADNSVTLFKRGAKTKSIKADVADEEKAGAVDEKVPSTPTRSSGEAPRMTDVFSWQHMNYVVPIPGKPDRQLLSDVSGYVAPGKLTALMGESGAGKTTLLNVLAMRTDSGVITGDRFVNGQPLPPDFQAQTAYCQQMDTHAPYSTVREALLFSAKLRQPASVPLEEKEAYVEKCLEMCGLVEYADAAVGSLSIEHKKRTTIGVELAAKVAKLLLFLDEPTSGLDSQSAWAIVSFLRELADKGQAILCTMLLLRKGGKIVYFGDIGHSATTLIQYFEKNGARKCFDYENPAEYMLDVIGAGATALSEQDWHEVWNRAPESQQLQDEIEAIHKEGRSRPAVQATFKSEFATSWGYQVYQLLKRQAEAYWRDPTYLMAKLVLNAVGGLFIGFTFFKSKDTQQGTQNKLFAIFMATILSVPLSNQLQVPFLNIRKIYEIRERPSRMYNWTALVTAQILIELPWNILGSTILFFTWYWTVAFESSRGGYTYLMMGIAFPFYYTTFAQGVAAMAPSAEIAALLFSFLFSFVITFNGVLQPFRALKWWRWMYHLSPFTYLIEGLLGQAIGKQIVNCSPVEFVSLTPPSGMTCGQYMGPYMSFAGGYLTNPNATSACQFCSVRTTDEFLGAAFNIYYSHHWRNFGILVAFIAFNVFLVFFLTYMFRIRKGSILPSFRRKN